MSCNRLVHLVYPKWNINLLIDLPEFVEVPVQRQAFNESASFTFNCTPSAANPPPSSYVFERDGVEITEGVSGSILLITSLERNDTGNYSCTVTNEAGNVTIATEVLVYCKKVI